MCHIQEYPPLSGCNAVLWGHNICWRARSRSGYTIATFHQCHPWNCACCWKRAAFLYSSLFKKPLFQSRFVIGVHVLPSLTLVRGSFYCRKYVGAFRIVSWVNIHYGVYDLDIWYVRLHIGASVGHTMYHDVVLFDSSCVAIGACNHVCLCSGSHQS